VNRDMEKEMLAKYLNCPEIIESRTIQLRADCDNHYTTGSLGRKEKRVVAGKLRVIGKESKNVVDRALGKEEDI